MIRKFTITGLIITSLIFPVAVLAQNNASSSAKQTRLAERETNLKVRADAEINKRVASLNNLISRLGSIKRISDADKSTFTGQIQSQITSLNNLKAKIDADTDPATLKTDVKSIVDTYRIYALFIPKIHLLSAADVMLQAADKLSDLAAKLQTKINEAKNGGADTTAMAASLTDMQAKIADAKSQYAGAENLVISLTPDGFPANKSQLQNARGMIQLGRQDLVAARKDAQMITQSLRALKIKK